MLAGGPVAEAVLDDVRRRTAALVAQGVTPGLGTILVGDDGASASYVRKKHETCEQVGIASFHADIPAEAGQQALLDAVERFNADPAVHAYIIQHPVPEGFDTIPNPWAPLSRGKRKTAPLRRAPVCIPSVSSEGRRVLRVDYAAGNPPSPLAWAC